MFLLSFIPDALIQLIVNGVLIAGIVGCVVSFFYASFLRIGIAFLAGFILNKIYFHIGYLQEKFSLVLEQRTIATDYFESFVLKIMLKLKTWAKLL